MNARKRIAATLAMLATAATLFLTAAGMATADTAAVGFGAWIKLPGGNVTASVNVS